MRSALYSPHSLTGELIVTNMYQLESRHLYDNLLFPKPLQPLLSGAEMITRGIRLIMSPRNQDAVINIKAEADYYIQPLYSEKALQVVFVTIVSGFDQYLPYDEERFFSTITAQYYKFTYSPSDVDLYSQYLEQP